MYKQPIFSHTKNNNYHGFSFERSKNMSISLNNSETKQNLMRAFAGESQARNRYTFAAKAAGEQKLYGLERLFLFTAEQERAHAKVFFDFLEECNDQNILIDAKYPVNVGNSMAYQLSVAHRNEYEEYEQIYPLFAQIAKEEGFPLIAHAFEKIAKIEKVHGDTFQKYAHLLENGLLFHEPTNSSFICLNCGYIFEGTDVPEQCPVCQHEQGYFVRVQDAPFH